MRRLTPRGLLRLLVIEIYYFCLGGELWILATHWPSIRPGRFIMNDWLIAFIIMGQALAVLGGVLAQRRFGWRSPI